MAGHRFNPEKAEKLLDPKRQERIHPNQVIEALELKESDTILDLGAGNGYYTIPLANSTKEKVIAVDIERKMLDLLQERAAQLQVKNITYVESNLEEIQLDDNSAEKGLVAFVTHEIPDLDKALSEFRRLIKPGGKLVVLDWEAIEMEQGPPLNERISSDTMLKILEDNGFERQLSFSEKGVYLIVVQF
ncbi:class I SAM-dependent methyltransferase [Bacillus sp. Marseille-P3661]|uniref:class I SAM-dependent methyltransferase n=1 Tax=Bacillus sp. Marseille-P3661 TaxID=1936234 RepID=UPI000C83AE09|nr:class I SAM-dependent methyltransferase [Bacillus sp. Marseille-P3661]